MNPLLLIIDAFILVCFVAIYTSAKEIRTLPKTLENFPKRKQAIIEFWIVLICAIIVIIFMFKIKP